MRGTVLQINVSPRGGLPKRPVPEAFVTPTGLTGDAVAHPTIHGGPRKAVLLIAAETIDDLIAAGYPLFYGALGENFTTRGIDRRSMRSGQRYRVGEALIELTKLRVPCAALEVYSPKLQYDIYAKDIQPENPAWARSGFYAAVIEPGQVHINDIIFLVDAA